ncbi:hypothetical protein ACTXT7_007243, partial [Hymenolepis weldensis]
MPCYPQLRPAIESKINGDSYSENRKSQLQSQTSSSPIPPSDENVPSTNDPSVSVAASEAPTRNTVNKSADVSQFIQSQTLQRDNEAYPNSHLSETDTNLHTTGPVFSNAYHRYTGDSDSRISPPFNHRSDNEIMYKPSSQVQQYENGDDSDGSDIDSEVHLGKRFPTLILGKMIDRVYVIILCHTLQPNHYHMFCHLTTLLHGMPVSFNVTYSLEISGVYSKDQELIKSECLI